MIVTEMALANVLVHVTHLEIAPSLYLPPVKKSVKIVTPTITIAVSADANICPPGLTGVSANVGLIRVCAIQMKFVVQTVATAANAKIQCFVPNSGGRSLNMDLP